MAAIPCYKNVHFVDGDGAQHETQLKLLLFAGDKLYIQLKEPLSLLVRRKDLRVSSLLKRDFKDFVAQIGEEADIGLVESRYALRKRGLLQDHDGSLSEEYMANIRVFLQLILWLAASPVRHVHKDKVRAQVFLKTFCETLLLVSVTPSTSRTLELAARLSCSCDLNSDGICSHMRSAMVIDAKDSPQGRVAHLLLNLYKLRDTCPACVLELSALLDDVAESVLQSTPSCLHNVTEAQVIRDAMNLHKKRRRMDEHFRTEALAAKLRRTQESHVRIAVAPATMYGWVQAKLQSYIGACRATPADRLVVALDAVRVGGEETVVFLAYSASSQKLMWLPVQ
eukprot:6484394-Amphidinium_carterae.3